ncbi:sn-glycerol-1-phosphate dehydrogenase [Pseudogracilibacillus auburnensis]|uniref:sn-glycerol-1-phosphate dehydrogenase n=1 Tax=Pseudogracilibacillus auburnensis TaxID=1494959 RepID=UPI001A96E693|nr:sn-glycerol-1-phosphate dehydrogenase [Pseudogracilibacillus auburnensis]MBO1005142.1 sn-glycerol-1-phosphate dehydrogenase [Pseudogracilibacillus auburnensis]
MNEKLKDIVTQAKRCECGHTHHNIPIENITIATDALEQSAAFMQNKNYRHATLIVDSNTLQASGKKMIDHLEKTSIGYSVCMIEPDENGDVKADEVAIVQALLGIPKEADVLLAIGAGTLHDITRFCSFKMEKPFISIPTAPSVDGFTSLGAPLIVKGFKQTFQTVAPIALFADTEVLRAAPKEMIAAGFGDMIAKFTSLADWKFGVVMADEPYCPLVEKLTKNALELCIVNKDNIAAGNEKGIAALIEGLIISGIAMLIFGQSHPASGGEHHMSHYWEMAFLKEKRPQVLHGAKVAVSTPLLAQLYKEEMQAILMASNQVENVFMRKKLKDNQEDIKAILNNIPAPDFFENLAERIGGISTTMGLGIDDELVVGGMTEAYKLRDRFTMLRFLNEELWSGQ